MATKSNEYNFPDRDRIGWAKCRHVLHLEPLKGIYHSTIISSSGGV